MPRRLLAAQILGALLLEPRGHAASAASAGAGAHAAAWCDGGAEEGHAAGASGGAGAAALGLIQHSVAARGAALQGRARGADPGGQGDGGAAPAAGQKVRDWVKEAGEKLQCSMHPTLCAEPFACYSRAPTPQETDYWRDAHIATEDGHANLRAWCVDPSFESTVVRHCLKNHDLRTSAQLLYKHMVSQGNGQTDGSYCFLEGHCSNTEVTYNTTIEEAEAMCDRKYGHENWTSLGFGDEPNDPTASRVTGFHTRLLTSYFGKLACAMGNFHCDVIYCRDTYCQKQEYIDKYGHFLKEYGYE